MRSLLGPVLRDYSVGLHRLTRVLSIVSALTAFVFYMTAVADPSLIFAAIFLSALAYWVPILIVKVVVWVGVGFKQ